ncbi:putative invertase inhibitor [Cannabis sativa]|uniref:putative invertase inhibitor n=1 Tax=Cannabis sativa TaxID=3483 RepID=UPI0029C9FDBD|nr:putative invertase inhibitor [Cannabis sativa]
MMMIKTPIFIFFIILTIIPHNKASIVHHQYYSSTNSLLINQTCKKCAEKSEVFSYNFCRASLQNVPITDAITNLQGLALVAMELALDNASSTILTIKNILQDNNNNIIVATTKNDLDPFLEIRLKDCLDLYSDAVTTLVEAIEAFMNQNYETARVWLSAVMEASSTCEEGFKERSSGDDVAESPLVKENYDLFQLSDIALCIATLLTFS